jgi:signal peptidase I
MTKKTVRREILEWVAVIALALLLAFGVRSFLIQPFRVQMGSMTPTILNDDLILVNKMSFVTSGPKRGDVVVFTPPNEPADSEEFIKRVIGLPGEWVDYDRDTETVYINGVPLIEETKLPDSDYSQEFPPPPSEGHKRGELLEDDQYYVLGDNRDSSKDSRYFGAVNQDDITGEAFIIFWPLNRFHFIR